MANGSPLINVIVEGEIANRPGERRIWQSNYVPVRAPSGEITGLAAACIEITQLKKAEEVLIRNEKLAAVGRLAAAIAHESNNPLLFLMNLLYLAQSAEDRSAIDEYLKIADQELRRAAAITNQTLRFYKQSTQAEGITTHELFESVLVIQRGRIVNSRVHQELRDRATVPVTCFDGEIRQVLNNLIGNAIDATHPDGGRLLVRSRVGTKWLTGGKGVVLSIADTGEGIAPEVRERLFEAFYTTKCNNGNGQGLWICIECVERHNGVSKFAVPRLPSPAALFFPCFYPLGRLQAD